MKSRIIKLPFKVKKTILALGSSTKNTLCLGKGRYAYLSPLHPDLNNFPDFQEFEKDVKYFLKKGPRIIAYDMHPDYPSSRVAKQLDAKRYRLCPVQHHHAHIVSCMLENALPDQLVIGVAFDGTGLGPGDQLWGGEFLICDYRASNRRAHIKEIPLLGGEKAIGEPWRVAAAWLYQAYQEKFLNLKVDFIKSLDKNKWRVLKQMQASSVNAPLSSSMGRLFDAVAALILNRQQAHFEAELAIELEKTAAGSPLESAGYPFEMERHKTGFVLNPVPMFKQIVADLKRGEAKEKMAYRFHMTAAEMIRKTCVVLRKENRLKRVVLSGGVFQNRILLQRSGELLQEEGFTVFAHREVPAGDAGISLGQVAIADRSSLCA